MPAVDNLGSAQGTKRIKTPPSQMGKPSNYKPFQQQSTEKSFDDRPEPDLVPPVSLLYDGFGCFMDDVRNCGAFDKGKKLELVVNVLTDEMTGFYGDDTIWVFLGAFKSSPTLSTVLL